VIRTFATTLESELGHAAIQLSAPFDLQLLAMRNDRHAKHAAFFLPAAIFFACAADTGDVAKTAQPVTQASTGSSASSIASSSARSTDNGAVYAPSSGSEDTGTSGSGGGQTSSESGSATDASSPQGASTTEEASTTEDGSAPDDASTTEAAAPCTTCAVELMYESDNATKTGGAAFEIEIVNTGTTAVDLSTVSVKYYFLADGLSGFIFDVYTAYINNAASSAYAAVGDAAVSGAVTAFTPSTATADSVLTITFAGAGSVPVGDFFYFKGELHDSSYSMEFTQTNDYSYNAMDDTKLTANMHIVVDIGAGVAWGTAP
jgi:cellulose binding protein with CBM3 domain